MPGTKITNIAYLSLLICIAADPAFIHIHRKIVALCIIECQSVNSFSHKGCMMSCIYCIYFG